MNEQAKKPTHFDYEAVVDWERKLRSHGIQFKISKKSKGQNIVHIEMSLSLLPGDSLPMFEAQKP